MLRKALILFALIASLLLLLSLPQVAGFGSHAQVMKPPVTAQTGATRYVVSYDAARVSNAAVTAAVGNAGGVVTHNYPQISVVFVASANPNLMAILRANPAIKISKDVFENWLPQEQAGGTKTGVRATPPGDPGDALWLGLQWNLYISKTVNAWAVTQGNPNIKVAVLDTGICAHHQDLAGKVNTQLSTSFVTEPDECDYDEYPTCDDCPAWEDRHYHGTHVAGTIASNNLVTAGVAPNVQLIAVKVLNCEGYGWQSDIVAGMMYAADAGADVINMSLGSFNSNVYLSDPEYQAYLAAYRGAIQYAQKEKGCLVVMAAGNEGTNFDNWPGNKYMHTPSMLGMNMQIPAISVGATTSMDMLATFSNFGITGETMTAPGGGVPSYSDFYSQFVVAPCDCHSTYYTECSQSHDWYLWIRGTSMAAPHVSGAAALVAGQLNVPKSYLWPVLIRQKLIGSTDDLGKKGLDPIYGYGRLNTLRSVQ
jgi:subtilisin family serine protease